MRHILVDTMGLLLMVVVHAANVSEQAGARQIMEKVAGRSFFGRLRLLRVDAGYQAGKDFCAWIKALLGWRVEVVKRPEVNAQKKAGFILLPRRWVVERTFAWLDNYRRLSKDYEYLPQRSEDDGLPRHDQPNASPSQTGLKTRFSHVFLVTQ